MPAAPWAHPARVALAAAGANTRADAGEARDRHERVRLLPVRGQSGLGAGIQRARLPRLGCTCRLRHPKCARANARPKRSPSSPIIFCRCRRTRALATPARSWVAAAELADVPRPLALGHISLRRPDPFGQSQRALRDRTLWNKDFGGSGTLNGEWRPTSDRVNDFR